MTVLGISVYLLLAICCAIHAVRGGRNLIWLFVLFSFPLLGSLVYCVVEVLPELRARRVGAGVAVRAQTLLDPEHELRAARDALARVPSAQNQLRLARALLERGLTHEAVEHFRACQAGPGGSDPEITYATGCALLEDGQSAQALLSARRLRQEQPLYQPERVALLEAQALAAAGSIDEARTAFAAALERFGSTEVRARYAIFAAGHGDLPVAEALARELADAERYWPRHTRELNRPLLRAVTQALGSARAGSAA